VVVKNCVYLVLYYNMVLLRSREQCVMRVPTRDICGVLTFYGNLVGGIFL
jgi:hypothetical protein